MTESFGIRLRRERERRHITLADIAERTKIKASLFDQLERDDISHWPSGIFKRSFMRAYADAIGLNPDTVIRDFLHAFPDPAATPADAVPCAASAAPDSLTLPGTATAARATTPALRLTLVETGLPFTGGRVLGDARRRWAAAAWDLGSLTAIAVMLFVFMNTFWMPFGVTALCYYLGGILLLGNSPGVCLFAPRPSSGGDGSGGSRPTRAPRHRADAVPVRTADASFRASRFRTERHREVRS